MNKNKSTPEPTPIRGSWLSAIAAATAIVFTFCMAIFIQQNSHFIADDFDHFTDAAVKSLPEMMLTRIDVHFVPLHKLSSYLIFKLAPLSFDLALLVMTAQWLTAMALLYLVSRRFIPTAPACLLAVVITASPVWIHVLVWWSAAAHRLPYFILQAAAILAYLRYRDRENPLMFMLCITLQVLAFGFYVKAVLFPVIFLGLEVCVAASTQRLSRAGIKLCIGLGVVSLLYTCWYLLSPDSMRVGAELTLIQTIELAIHQVLRLGAVLLFLPLDYSLSVWISMAFWGVLAYWSIWRSRKTALPIIVLLVILFISSALNVAGRGEIIAYYFGVMRYCSEEIVVIGLFLAIIISMHANPADNQHPVKPNARFILIGLMLLYPVASYLSSTTLFHNLYHQHVQARSYLNTLQNSLNEAAAEPAPPAILKGNFPAFVYGFLGASISMEAVMGAAYPGPRWVDLMGGIKDLHQIDDEGRLRPLQLPDAPPFDNDLSFNDWHEAEATHRWSRGNRATIYFTPVPGKVYQGVMEIEGPVIATQRVTVYLNDQLISSLVLHAGSSCCEWNVHFSPDLLQAGINKFVLELPDALQAGAEDKRIIAIGVRELKIF